MKNKVLNFLLFFTVVTQIAARDCSRIEIKKSVFKEPIKKFGALNNDQEKIEFFKNKVEEFKLIPYTQKFGSCEFIRHSFSIKAIYKMYSYIKGIKASDLNIAGIKIFYEFVIIYTNKLATGPFYGEDKEQETVNEIKAITKIDPCLQQAINEFKRIEHWERNGVCDTIIHLEIEKSKLPLKILKFFPPVKEDTFVDMDYDDICRTTTVERLEAIEENYKNINCFNEKYKEDVSTLIEKIEQGEIEK
jgi:hypothetical protein